MRKNNVVRSLIAVGLLLPSMCYGAGLELLEQSARGLGQGQAGTVLEFGDGSSAFYNPAAMTELDQPVFTIGGTLIKPQAHFHNQGSTINPLLGGQPLTGGNGGDAAGTGAFPSLYYVHPIDDFRIGLAVTAPYGLETDYPKDWAGRYHALHSQLSVISFNPAVAWKATDSLSIGANANVYYADGTLGNAIDFGTIGVGSLGPVVAGQLGLAPQQSDGLVNFNGNGWAVGFSLGTTYEIDEATKIGFNWRTRVNMQLNGSADFTVPQNALPLTSTGAFTDTHADSSIPLPEHLTFAAEHKLNDQWTIAGEAAWVRWSRLNDLVLNFSSIQPAGVVNEDWDNTWRFSTGANYKACNTITLRSGFTLDQTPVSDALHRTPRLPDGDRYWLTLGAGYDITDDTTLDIGYGHAFATQNSTSVTSPTGDTLNGQWSVMMDVVSVQLTMRM